VKGGVAVPLVYYKRFRMEVDLRRAKLAEPHLPPGYVWTPWRPDRIERHAWAKYRSFHEEIDASVFSSLSNYEGCLRLMSEISRRDGFLPQATWLITRPCSDEDYEDVATIQGLVTVTDRLFLSEQIGAIQNVGVTPEHRGLGLGRALVLKSLWGFREAGLRSAYLEVTANNRPAVQLYRSLGFRLTKTSYKGVDEVAVDSVVWR